MDDLALDPSNGDLIIVDFDLAIVSSTDQIAQNLAIRLRFIQGEWYLNILDGIPYYQYFFIKNPNQIQIETFLKDEIINTQGVTQLTSFTSSFNGANRKFVVSFGCTTISGNLEMEIQVP